MATTRKQVSYGSSGSDVTELQKALNNNGYNLAVDGQFGSKTQAAVKDYQAKNGLAVDGIVGVNTWGALGSASAPSKPQTSTVTNTQTATPSTSTPSAPTSTGNYAPYTESNTVAQAKALLDQQIAAKPGEYKSTWEGQLSDTIAKILNREQYSYDLNGDALYQQYKDRFIQQGQMAMMDTMGKAATMTGGYGNSYTQSVGQQAYQDYLQQLNDVVPELQKAAYDRYNQEGQDLYNQYAMLGEQDARDYARYQDGLSAYYAELDRLQNQYNAERDYDYSKYIDDRNFAYQQDRDAVADNQWQQQYDESIRQYNQQFAYQQDRDAVADNQWQQQYDESIRQYNQQFAYQQDRDAVADDKWQQEFDYSKSVTDSNTAYERAMDLISNGIVPNAEELTKAGIDSTAASTLARKSAAVATGESDLDPQDWYTINEKCAEYAASGDDDGMLEKYINGLVDRGWITDEECAAFYLLYFPDSDRKMTDTTVQSIAPSKGANYTGGGGGVRGERFPVLRK